MCFLPEGRFAIQLDVRNVLSLYGKKHVDQGKPVVTCNLLSELPLLSLV